MYCENCGKKIPDDSQFCPECGAPVHHEDESLIARARRNDNEAIQQLMDQYKGMVRYQARIYVKNEDDVNEIEQQVYIKAFSKTSDLTDEKKFGGWLKTIAINTAKDYVTSAFKKRSVMFTDLDDTNNDMVYDAADERIDHVPEAQMDETSRRDIILKVLDSLPESQRTVIVMHYYDNLSFKDIAEQLDIPMSTVTGRAQQAKNSIKASVTEIQNREGIKLYHLSPLGFFIWIVGLEKEAPVAPPVYGKTAKIEPQKVVAKDKPHYGNPGNNVSKTVKAEKTVKNTAKATSRTAIKAGAGKTAAGEATKAAGTGFLATTAGKAVIAGAIAVAAIGGGTAGVHYHNEQTASGNREVISQNADQKKSGRKTDASGEKEVFDEKNFVWIAEPGTIDLDDFDNFETKNISYHDGYEENIGYSPAWPGFVKSYDLTENNNVYSGDEILGKKDGKAKVYSFDGKEIKAVPHDQSKDTEPYSDEITEQYDQSYTFISNNKIYRLSQLSNSYDDIGCKPGGDEVNAIGYKENIDTPVIIPVKNGLGCSDIKKAVKGPDGFMVTGNYQDAVNVPKGMTPSYYPDYLKNEKDNTRNIDECFVNGVMKLLDKDGKIHLWNFNTRKYVSKEAFNDTTYFENGYIGIQKNSKWAFMDIDGKRVTDYVFDKVSGIYEGKAYVRYKGKTGVLDLKASLKKNGESIQENSAYAFLAGHQFIYASGVGGWANELCLREDGSFYGQYHDSEMGDIGEGYPLGSEYLSQYKGSFTNLKKIDDVTYQMTMKDCQNAGDLQDDKIIEGRRIVFGGPGEDMLQKTYTIHLPGAKVGSLPEGVRNNMEWVDKKDSDVVSYIVITMDGDDLAFTG